MKDMQIEDKRIDAKTDTKKRKAGVLVLLGLLLFLSGCGSRQEKTGAEETTASSRPLTGNFVPVAEYREVKQDLNSLMNYCWIEEDIVYQEQKWIEGKNMMQNILYREPADGSHEPEIMVQDEPGEISISCFFADTDSNLYLFGKKKDAEEQKNYFYLRKLDAQGNELYCTLQKDASTNLTDKVWIVKGFADSLGNSVLIDNDGWIYLFDDQGNFVGSNEMTLRTDSAYDILDAGEQGLYLWQQNYNGNKSVVLQEIDRSTGSLKEPKEISLENQMEMAENYTICSGGEKGMLVSTESRLLQYDFKTGEFNELLEWQNENINADGTAAKSIRFSQQSDMEVLFASFSLSTPEIGYISYIDEAQVPEREHILLGVSEYSDVAKLVRSFNRSNMQYYAEIQSYDNGMLEQALRYEQGEAVPDLLDLTWISPDLLVHLGLLEDLEPYFEKSEQIAKDDIQESVWNAGCVEGRQIGAITGYSIQTVQTTLKEAAPGWTKEDVIAIAGAHSDTDLLEYNTPDMIMLFFMETMLQDYIDFEQGKCSFGSEKFVEFMEQVKELSYSEQLPEVEKVQMTDDIIRDFLSGKYLLRREYVYSPYFYHTTQMKYGNKVQNVGFPNNEKEPWFLIYPTQQLGIYSGSACKEGAWAFIEYALSRQEQSWYGAERSGFPVRKDAFEEFLSKPYSRTMKFQDDKITEEEKDELRYMTEHLKADKSMRGSPVYDIVFEEVGAFFAGDKTARETADVIQNRVQLYLDENL